MSTSTDVASKTPPKNGGKGNGNGRKKKTTPRSPLSAPPPAADSKRKKVLLNKHLMQPDPISSSEEEKDTLDKKLDSLLSIMDADEAKSEGRKKAIRDMFIAMDEDERQDFIQKVYDRFSEHYDDYMEETGHYDSIRRLLTKEASVHTFQFPILDISAGTGVPLAHFLTEINKKHTAEGNPISLIKPQYKGSIIYVNDLAEKMVVKAEIRLEALKKKLLVEAADKSLEAPPLFADNISNGMEFKTYSFRRLHNSLKRKFGTILVSQTFHVVSYKDKQRLADAINWALAPGGRVILLEEFDWRTSPHLVKTAPPSVVKMVGAIASPFKTKKELLIQFKDSDGIPYDMVSRSIERIDREDPNHEMTITVLQKPNPDNDHNVPLWF